MATATLPTAVQTVTLTPSMDFGAVMQLLLAGKVTPEQVAEYQAAQVGKGSANPVKGARPKTTPSLTRAEFLATAKALEVSINGIPAMAEAKQFSTGSLGWGANGKVQVKVGDKLVVSQMSLNLTVVGSKDMA